ncbi:MAG: methionine sulfoxide reductase heme-binding subunit [Actinomycetota bacterium]|nr:methionine sulfoxide reductase heme-binding subunit [Actinomycetota bacterium]
MTGSGSALWYLSRGTGVVSLLLLTLVVVLGVLTRGGRPVPGLPRFAVAALHRNAALLSVVFLAIHVCTAIADPYVTIRWISAIVPFTATYHPLGLASGALSLDLILAVVVTSTARRFVGARVFRLVHWSVYAAWPVAVAHSLQMGPDITSGILLGLAVMCIVAVLVAVGWRIAATPASKSRPSNVAGVTRKKVAA